MASRGPAIIADLRHLIVGWDARPARAIFWIRASTWLRQLGLKPVALQCKAGAVCVARASVLGAVHVGDSARIGAGVVLLGDAPADKTLVGNWKGTSVR